MFGYNHYYFSSIPQITYSSPYFLYGFQPHFGFAHNVMFLITMCTYGIAVILIVLLVFTPTNAAKRIKNVAFYIANDISYALVVFCIPSVITAICLEISEGTSTGSEVPWSRFFFVGSIIMLVVAHLLNLAFA